MAINSIDYEKCTGCGECVNACEQDVLRMDEDWVVVHPIKPLHQIIHLS